MKERERERVRRTKDHGFAREEKKQTNVEHWHTITIEPTARGSSPLALRLTFTPAAKVLANRLSFMVPCTYHVRVVIFCCDKYI